MLLCHAAIFSGLFQRPMTGCNTCNTLVDALAIPMHPPKPAAPALSLQQLLQHLRRVMSYIFSQLTRRLFPFAPGNFRLW